MIETTFTAQKARTEIYALPEIVDANEIKIAEAQPEVYLLSQPLACNAHSNATCNTAAPTSDMTS